jgi:PmbA protein
MESLHKIKDILLKKGINDLVLKKIQTQETSLKFVNNKIVKTELSTTTFIDVFAEKNKKLITTTIKQLDTDSIKKTANKILEFIKNSQPNQQYRKIPENKFKYKEIEKSFDKKILNINESDLVESAINAALKNANRADGIFEKSIGHVSLLTSTGIEQEDKFTTLYLSIRAFKTKEASGHKTLSSRILAEFDVEKAGKEAGEIASLSKNPVEGKPGKYNVIFSPLAFAPILDSIGEAASIFSVESGMSFLTKTKDLGNFTLIDDGTLPNGINSSKFDDEGYPTQRTTIIEKGTLKTYLHNTSSAERYNTKSTGNAGIISPEPTNIIIEGKIGNPFNINKGIYITNVWYTRFQNYATGDFSTIPRDGMFIIKNGKIDHPIKNLRVSDNVLNLLKNIQVFGKDKEQITSWEAETPAITSSVLIKNVNLTKPIS